MNETPRTVLVTGYAPAPKGTSMYEIYKIAGVSLEIDLATDTIVGSECTFVTNLAREFVGRLMQGYDVNHDLDELLDRLSTYYLAPSSEAVRRAVKVAVQRYFDQKHKILTTHR
jgi:hypothetical protein